jgi:hypothetical protein
MSANIYARQVKPVEGIDINVSAPSWFIGTMEKAFGHFPCVLSDGSIQTLRGMSATVSGEYNPFEELIELIEKLGKIEVYAEY